MAGCCELEKIRPEGEPPLCLLLSVTCWKLEMTSTPTYFFTSLLTTDFQKPPLPPPSTAIESSVASAVDGHLPTSFSTFHISDGFLVYSDFFLLIVTCCLRELLARKVFDEVPLPEPLATFQRYGVLHPIFQEQASQQSKKGKADVEPTTKSS